MYRADEHQSRRPKQNTYFFEIGHLKLDAELSTFNWTLDVGR